MLKHHVRNVAQEGAELTATGLKHPNAVIKVSGACTLSREPYPFPDIWDPLARAFDAWGFDRCPDDRWVPARS
jgi:hypothetical protein